MSGSLSVGSYLWLQGLGDGLHADSVTGMEEGALREIAARLTAHRLRSIIHLNGRSSHAPTNTATVGVTSTGGVHGHNTGGSDAAHA